MERAPRIVFATQDVRPPRDDIAAPLSAERERSKCERFRTGKRYSAWCRRSTVGTSSSVGGTISDSDTLELYDLACALVGAGARRFTLVLPYFGYSTMERAVLPVKW